MKCSSRRASKNGCVFMTLTEFMELFGLTGRLLMPGKSGAMPKNASPILDRLNLFAELQPQGSTQWRSVLWSELMFRCAAMVHGDLPQSTFHAMISVDGISGSDL